MEKRSNNGSVIDEETIYLVGRRSVYPRGQEGTIASRGCNYNCCLLACAPRWRTAVGYAPRHVVVEEQSICSMHLVRFNQW